MNSEKLLEESFRYENSLCKFFVTEDTVIPTASRLRLSNAKKPRHLSLYRVYKCQCNRTNLKMQRVYCAGNLQVTTR